jgi:hypothetical protein
MRHGVLAADLEPGLRGAYVNEELFSDVHGAMIREGMWLSRMEVLGFPRMRKGTLDELSSKRPLDEEMITRSVRRTPGWVECRTSARSSRSRNAGRGDAARLTSRCGSSPTRPAVSATAWTSPASSPAASGATRWRTR